MTHVAWEHLGWGVNGYGCELLRLTSTHGLGVILWIDERARPYRLEYEIEWAPDRTFRRVSIDLAGGASGTLQLTRDPDGRWKKNGVGAPDLRDCTEVDIWPTPFTNSLPIRRLQLEPGAAATISVAHVVAPELTVTPRAQRYTNLGDGRYRFESLHDGFTADLVVDEAGLVVDYPALFRRRAKVD